MTITFSVSKKRFKDSTNDSGANVDLDTTLAAAIKTWLDALGVTTVYALQIEYVKGFWEAIVVYA